MKSLLFPCAYGFMYLSDFLCKRNKVKRVNELYQDLIFSSPYSCTQDLCICINVKIMIMKEVFFCLFLMDIAVGGGLRLID